MDQRYHFIALLIAHYSEEEPARAVEGFTTHEIRERAREIWKEGFEDSRSEDAFRVLLDEMIGLGILREASGDGARHYALRNGNVPLLMGTPEEILSALLTLSEQEPHRPYEPEITHRQYGPGRAGRRSPLTLRQESDLLQRANGVGVVFGTAAAGLNEVAPVLDERLPESCTVLSSLVDASGFQDAIERLGRPKRDTVAMVIIAPTCHWTEDWVRAAAQRTDRMRSRESWQRFVFLADPSKTWQLVCQQDALGILEGRNAARLTLEPWHPRALRQWIEDLDRTESAVSTCLAGLRDLTGHWHGPLYALREHLIGIAPSEWPMAWRQWRGCGMRRTTNTSSLNRSGLSSTGRTSCRCACSPSSRRRPPPRSRQRRKACRPA